MQESKSCALTNLAISHYLLLRFHPPALLYHGFVLLSRKKVRNFRLENFFFATNECYTLTKIRFYDKLSLKERDFRMNKKISAVVAAVVAVVLGVCFAVSSFGFVKDNYGENQIQALAGMGLIDSRSPTAKVTRAEALIAVMVITGMDVYVEDYSPEDFPCPYTDVSADLLPYVTVAYAHRIVEDMPYDLFSENDNITLEEMLHMTLESYGLVTEKTNALDIAESHNIYKTCEADALVFDLTYATYAEILWNLLEAPSLYEDGKKLADLLVERSIIDPEAYEAAKGIMADYVFGQKHDYVTKAFSWFDPSDNSESESETTDEPVVTTAPPADTSTPVTSYDTEDNSGYSPPFKP